MNFLIHLGIPYITYIKEYNVIIISIVMHVKGNRGAALSSVGVVSNKPKICGVALIINFQYNFQINSKYQKQGQERVLGNFII